MIFYGQKRQRKRYIHSHSFEDVLGARLKVFKGAVLWHRPKLSRRPARLISSLLKVPF